MWYKAGYMGPPVRLKLTVSQQARLANHYTTWNAQIIEMNNTINKVMVECGTRLDVWDTQRD